MVTCSRSAGQEGKLNTLYTTLYRYSVPVSLCRIYFLTESLFYYVYLSWNSPLQHDFLLTFYWCNDVNLPSVGQIEATLS